MQIGTASRYTLSSLSVTLKNCKKNIIAATYTASHIITLIVVTILIPGGEVLIDHIEHPKEHKASGNL